MSRSKVGIGEWNKNGGKKGFHSLNGEPFADEQSTEDRFHEIRQNLENAIINIEQLALSLGTLDQKYGALVVIASSLITSAYAII